MFGSGFVVGEGEMCPFDETCPFAWPLGWGVGVRAWSVWGSQVWRDLVV